MAEVKGLVLWGMPEFQHLHIMAQERQNRRPQQLNEASVKLLDMMIHNANDQLTAAEARGHREFIMARIYKSA